MIKKPPSRYNLSKAERKAAAHSEPAMVGLRPWCLLCPADTEWTAINYIFMPVFFPVGMQLIALLLAESTTDFNRLEGKIEQEIVIYLQFSSFCPFIWEKMILQEKACTVHKFQQTHDGLLQSYQTRGKINCCVTIPTKFWGPWNIFLYNSPPNFLSSLSLSLSLGQETTQELPQHEHSSNIMKSQIFRWSFAL